MSLHDQPQNQPAFPLHERELGSATGLTKREYAAIEMLKSVIPPNRTDVFGSQSEVNNRIATAIHYADSLLAELARTEKKA